MKAVVSRQLAVVKKYSDMWVLEIFHWLVILAEMH
jgi:hypothetical protein